MQSVGVVVIGRNEGERLRRCVQSLCRVADLIVYVDSGSTDGSVDFARSAGVEVVELDRDLPFTAARGRNAGFERLMSIRSDLAFVQFVDGDCEVVAGWIEHAVAELQQRPELAAVCGRRRERFPEASIYNRLCDIEWNTPVGEADACGGDSMMRCERFRAVGGFDQSVPAGEEPELCLRLRKAGWKIARLDAEMTLHDAAILRFSQWWRRSVRGGHGSLDVAVRFERDGGGFWTQVRSVWMWSLVWPIACGAAFGCGWVIAGVVGGGIGATVVFLAWPAQVIRVAMKKRDSGLIPGERVAYGLLTMVGKWAQLAGHWRWLMDRRAGRAGKLIEYKGTSSTRLAKESE